MKKGKYISAQLKEDASQREKRWKELRSIMEQYKSDGLHSTPNKLTTSREKEQQSEVFTFLKDIGLEKYFTTMRDNAVDDLEIMKELNEKHLEELGIPMGHRIKIIKKLKESHPAQEAKPSFLNSKPPKPAIKTKNIPPSKPIAQAKPPKAKPNSKPAIVEETKRDDFKLADLLVSQPIQDNVNWGAFKKAYEPYVPSEEIQSKQSRPSSASNRIASARPKKRPNSARPNPEPVQESAEFKGWE